MVDKYAITRNRSLCKTKLFSICNVTGKKGNYMSMCTISEVFYTVAYMVPAWWS